jgi:hypothetical protein
VLLYTVLVTKKDGVPGSDGNPQAYYVTVTIPSYATSVQFNDAVRNQISTYMNGLAPGGFSLDPSDVFIEPWTNLSDFTGPAGPQGPQGPAGSQGPTGPQGPAGAGLVSGAILELLTSTPPPPGFTKLGTTEINYKDTAGRPAKLQVDLYRKN